jgi:hypothetical protein
MSHMDRSAIEAAAMFILFMVMILLGNSINLQKFNRRYAPGAVPKLKSSRLPFRFSLRTLLIAMTLAAVGTVVVAYAFR